QLVNDNSHSAQALRTLLDIYQQEKAWEKAIDAATKYEAVTRQSMHTVVAHYYCELAETTHNKKRNEQATDYLEKAVAADKYCVRASLLQAKVLIEEGDYKNALRCLKKIKDQNPDYLSEAIDLLAVCHEKLNKEEELVVYLKSLVDEYPRVPVVLI